MYAGDPQSVNAKKETSPSKTPALGGHSLNYIVRQPYTPACSIPNKTNHGMYDLLLIVTVGADFTPRIALCASDRRCLSTHSGALCQSSNSRRQQPD